MTPIEYEKLIRRLEHTMVVYVKTSNDCSCNTCSKITNGLHIKSVALQKAWDCDNIILFTKTQTK